MEVKKKKHVGIVLMCEIGFLVSPHLLIISLLEIYRLLI